MNLPPTPIGTLARTTLLWLWLLAAGGCGAYMVEGRVVSGPRSTASIVKPGDPALAAPGIEQASVQLVLDPRSGGRQSLGTVFTDENGRFAIPVDALGAGTLEYELLVTARAPEKAPAQELLDLPPRGSRLLIRLADGRDRPMNPDEWIGDTDVGSWESFGGP